MSNVLTVNGIRAEDYLHWRHHPVSKIILQFMRDRSAALEAEMLARWRNKVSNLVDENEERGRIEELTDFADLQFETLIAFYQTEQPESE